MPLFVGPRADGEVAPITAVREAATEPPGSTKLAIFRAGLLGTMKRSFRHIGKTPFCAASKRDRNSRVP